MFVCWEPFTQVPSLPITFDYIMQFAEEETSDNMGQHRI